MLEELEIYAKNNKIPIMEKEGILFLKEYIKNNNIKTILELGTAIGYSAIQMALLDKNIKIITIERDEKRYKEAIKNIKKFHLENQITCYLMDIFDFETNDFFDLIFIDAAKSQSIKFFEKFKKNLNKNGTILTDNIYFHGYTLQKERIESKNLRQMVHKIRGYIDFLNNNKEFKTEFLEIGDGIAVTTKKQN